MPFIVIYDACVLYPASQRDLLVRLASKRIIHARWSNTILEEMRASLLSNHPHLHRERLNRTLELMNRAVRLSRCGLIQAVTRIREILAADSV